MKRVRSSPILEAIGLSLASFLVAILVLELGLRLVAPQELYVVGVHEWHPDGFYLNKSAGKGIQAAGPVSAEMTFGPFHTRRNSTHPSNNGNRKRVLFLGDSFTFGWLLNDGKTYISQLQDMYPDIELLNAASGGWGTADQLRYLELFCARVKPQLVVSVVNLDDLERSLAENLYAFDAASKTPRRIERDLSERTLRQKINESWVYRSVLKQSHLYRFVRGSLLDVFPVVFDPFMEGRDEAVREFLQKGDTSSFESSSSKEFVNVGTFGTKEESPQWTPTDLMKQLYTAIQQVTDECGADLWVVWLGWQKLAPSGGFTSASLFEMTRGGFFRDSRIDFYNLEDSAPMKTLRENYEMYTHAPHDSHPNELGAQAIRDAFYEVVGPRLRNLALQ